MEDNLKYFCKWNVLKMEDSLNFFENERQPQFLVNEIIMQPETFKIETMVVAPLRVTLSNVFKHIFTKI